MGIAVRVKRWAPAMALLCIFTQELWAATLEEVVVTAQKREESLQDVPISVVALSAETLAQSNLEELEDIAAFTPNLNVYSMPPFTSLSVRGLGSQFDKGFEHSAGLFLDGIYVGRLAFLDSAFLDVASIEVLRGPQGSLFGKNTISGALSIRSVQPGDELELSLQAQGGDRNYEKYTAIANVPLGERAALRFAGLRNDRDGNVYNTTLDRTEGDKQSDLARLSGRWEVTDWLDISAATMRIEQDYTLGIFQVQTASDDQRALMELYDPEFETNVRDFRASQNYPAETEQSGKKHDLTFNWRLGEHEFSLLNSVSTIDEDARTDLDFSPIPLLYFQNTEDYEQQSHELRIVSPLGMFDGALDYVAGFYYAESDTDIQVIIDAAPEPGELVTNLPLLASFGPLGSVIDGVVTAALGTDSPGERLQINGRQRNISTAAYGQAVWHFAQDWSLTAGLRYSREKKSVNQFQKLYTAGTDVDGPIFTQLVTAEEYTLIKTRIDESISPKLSLAWEFNDDISLYLSVADGFKSGGYSGSAVSADVAEVEPESSITYELGAKTQWLDGAARANIAVFRTEFEDLQLTIFEGNVSRIANAAGAISQGIELDAQFITDWGIRGLVSAAYLDAYFTDYPNGVCPVDEENPPCDLSGRPLSNAPKYKANISLDYDNDLGTWPIRMNVGVDYLYKDDVLLNPDQDPIDRQDAYATFNYRLSVADDEDRWRLQAIVRNATDVHAIDASGDIPTLSGAHFARAIGGRELDVSLSLRF